MTTPKKTWGVERGAVEGFFSPHASRPTPHAPFLARRVRWPAVAAVVAGVLALGGFLSRGWFHDWAEIGKALELVEENQFDAALPLLLDVHERRPQNITVTRALAVGYLHNTRQLPETREYLDRWCELQPAEAEPFRLRMRFWMMQEMVSEAISDAQHVLELRPSDFETHGKLVELLLTAGRYQEAETEGLRCFKQDPQNVELWFILANIYRGLGQASGQKVAKAKAADLTDQVLRVKPDHTAALKLRAKLYLEAGQPDLAIRLLKERLVGRSSFDEIQGLYELSEALGQAGRDAEAKEVMAELEWRQALGLWTRHEFRDENLGLQKKVVEAMLAAGKADEAVRFLTSILERKPQAPAATHELLALSYEKQGFPERAQGQRRLAQQSPPHLTPPPPGVEAKDGGKTERPKR